MDRTDFNVTPDYFDALCPLAICISLKLSENELERIVEKQGGCAKDIVELVKENEKTLNGMKVRSEEK